MTFLINRKDVVLVKPAEPTPSDILSLSSRDNDPSIELLSPALFVYQSNTNNSSDGHQLQPADPAFVLKEALSRALIYYYPLAGQLKRQSDGRLIITCTGDGVPFLEATADCDLSSLNHFEGVDPETAQQFVFDWPSDSEFGYYPLVFQVTNFSCGGFTIGMGLSHSICDGYGAAQFLKAVAEIASGKPEPTTKPVWERERLLGTPNPDHPTELVEDDASLVTSPFLPATEISHACFNVTGECIQKLKTRLTGEICDYEILNEGFTFTTLEVLAAYVWRSRFRALQQNSEGKTKLFLAVGMRNFSNPPVPAGYYGNAFVSAQTVLLGSDLDEGPLSRVAKLIKDSKKGASSDEHVKEELNLLETMIEHRVKVKPNGANWVLTDWRQLKLLEDVDFGWKSSVNTVKLPWNMFGYVDLCIFMPPCKLNSSMEGGVRVAVSFPKQAMPKFKEEMDALSAMVSTT